MQTPRTFRSTRRSLVAALTITAIAVVTASPAGAADVIPHPAGAADVVFHTETGPNFWGGEYPDAAEVTVYGDGRVVLGDGAERRMRERQVQRLLRGARRVGLLDGTDFGEALVTDQGTTVIEVQAGGAGRSIEVYALELPDGDRGLPRAQRVARQRLRAFLHRVGQPSYWRETRSG